MKQFPFRSTRVFSEYLKIQNIIFTSIQLEVEVLNQHRQFYNPSKFICQIKKAYKSNNLINLISALSCYSWNTFIFYFLPIWIISLPLYLVANFKVWRSTWLKTSFLIFEYKIWTRNALMANWKGPLDCKIIISFFPFIFGISYIIYSRYQNQVFPYFIHKNLPGISPSFPRLRWDTFQNITYYQLNLEPTTLTQSLPNKDILLSQEIIASAQNPNSKIINIFTQPENRNEVPNFSNVSDSNKDSLKADYPQPSITPAFKLNRFIKQLDFYTDSFLIKLNSAWLNKKKQVYVGFFPKKKLFQYSRDLVNNKKSCSAEHKYSASIDTNFLLNTKTSYQIGNNWNLVSPKKSITFSTTAGTQFDSPAIFFTDKLPFISNTQNSLKKVGLEIKPTLKNYWEAFYLNLDELPKKLNSRSLPICWGELSNLNTDETSELLPVQHYSNESDNFFINTFGKDKKTPHQMSVAEFPSTKEREVKFKYQKIYSLLNFLPYGLGAEFPQSGKYVSSPQSFQRKRLSTTKIYNRVKSDQLISPTFFRTRVAPKTNLNRKNILSIQTIDGFFTRSPFHEFEKGYLKAKFLLYSKDNLLQNELRQDFYDNGLTRLPNVSKLASNINTYKSVLNILLDNNFLSNNNYVLEQEADNLVILNQQEITHLKNESKVVLADPSSSLFDEYCPEHILQILQNFGPLKINIAIKPRLMSGYEFPDISNRELRSLILQYFYQTTLASNNNPLPLWQEQKLKHEKQNKLKVFSPILKVELPPSFTSYLNYTYSNPKTPSLKLSYKATCLKGDNKTFYKGPGVLRDDSTRYVRIINKDKVTHWVNQFLSSDNPLTDRREVFFGQNKSKVNLATNELVGKKKDEQITFLAQENSIIDDNRADLTTSDNLIETSNLNLQISDLNSKADSSLTSSDLFVASTIKTSADAEIQQVKKYIEQPLIPKTKEIELNAVIKFQSITLPILSFVEELQVPYLDKPEWHAIFEKLKADFEKDLKANPESDKKFEVEIPMISIRHPKQQNIQWPLSSLDYQTLNDFIFTSQTNLVTQIANLGSKVNSSIIFEDITYTKDLCSVLVQGLKKKNSTSINYHYLPSAQILLNDNLPQKKFFGNMYKKVFTFYENILENKYESFNLEQKPNYATRIFVKNFTTVFYQSWEPITTGSWMMITQVSFILVVLQILQEFYRKYGKELVSYLFDLMASLGIIDETLKNEFELNDGGEGFRLIRKVPKRFRDIAGIDDILPELGEIVWFLRNSGRSFKVGNIIPKGILLIGSPGTGKTLLVQAIAGEAEVPVLVQSGSSLNDPEQKGNRAQSLKNLFEQARKMAPCIVFIDEIDALGEKRENVIQNPMGTDEIIESIQEPSNFTNLSSKQFIPKPKIKFDKGQSNNVESQQQDFFIHDQEAYINQNLESPESGNLDILQQSIDKQESKQEQLSLLMQFLIEMDGLRARKGVIVIGATNRPDVLDLALTRPGRFDQTLQLELPEKQRRIEILKLYSKNLGTIKNISWDYLANRTVGFSAADLAAVMNESSMKAILDETIHTIETIEKGIESITSYSSETIKRESTGCVDPFLISRLAYYQAGKAIVHTLLLQHPAITVLHLWQKKKNARHIYISSIIQNQFLKSSRKLELESRVVGLYAGKAAELLILSNNLSFISIKKRSKASFSYELELEQKNSNTKKKASAFISGIQQRSSEHKHSTSSIYSKKLWQSDIGIEDLTFATYLVESMISKWYFYSKNLVVRNSNQILHQRNLQEIQELDTIDLFNELATETETEIIRKTRSSGLKRDYQKWSIRPWWQTQITQQIGVLYTAYDDWYRIYLPDPEESERNKEWVAPDEYYHNNNQLSDLVLNSTNCCINWNDLYVHDRDYISHGLLLTCFNTAFTILDKNRELLDYLAAYLMRNDIIREPEMTDILLQFKPNLVLKTNLKGNDNYKKSKAETEKKVSVENEPHDIEQNSSGFTTDKISSWTKQEEGSLEKTKKVRVIDNSWGSYSRRKMCRFFTF